MRVYFFISTIICEAPQRFLAGVKSLSSLQQPAGYPVPSLTSPLEMKSRFRVAQMLSDSPQDIFV